MDADFYDVESLFRMANLAGVCGKGIFSSLGNVVNYYSPEDEVLQDGDGSLKLLGREFAWYNQETRKGYFPYVADNEAGWEFNPQYDVETTQYIGGNPITMTRHLTGTEANALTDEQLKTSPFFSGFHDETILVTSNGVDIASNLELRARVLAYGIPAESFSVGTGALGEHFLRETDMVEQNLFDEGGNRKSGSPYWRHSDFIALPVKWTFSLFADIVNQINQGGSGNER